jgi:hypothetical protein
MQDFFIFIVVAIIYMFPTAIAYQRGHQSQGWVAALNILLGWSLIGWVIALIWSCSAVSRPARASASFDRADPDVICPYCRAGVDPQARKCKHCGEWIEGHLIRSSSSKTEGRQTL